MRERIILADLGIVTALGRGVAETESRMFAGDTSGMKRMDGVLPEGETTVFGFAGADCAPTRVGALVDEAMRQLQPSVERLGLAPERIGAVIGTSNSTMEEFTENPGKIDMAYPAERLRERWNVKGPVWTVSTACSSSAKAFASARGLLEDGLCDAVIVGGADAMTRVVVNGFNSLEATSPDLTRPLSADRDGISLGEGAALFLMVPAERFPPPPSAAGGPSVFLLGVGESSDAHHLTAPDPEGKGAEAAMRAAVEDAGLAPEDVGYINLHGTGTTYNDSMECAAVRRVFGDRVPASSTKPLTGHTLGAAGAIEVALCWIALRSGRGVPPHAVAEVDTALAPFPVAGTDNGIAAKTALSNSFAFGGSNASVLIGL